MAKANSSSNLKIAAVATYADRTDRDDAYDYLFDLHALASSASLLLEDLPLGKEDHETVHRLVHMMVRRCEGALSRFQS